MRIIQARCEVKYSGRCDTFLPEAMRVIIIKSDNSVMIHTDTGIKPLNYMKASQEMRMANAKGSLILIARSKKESLIVSMSEIVKDIIISFDEEDNAIMEKTGTENLLQGEIARTLPSLIPNAVFACREFETGKGPCDILGIQAPMAGETKQASALLIEVKRKAHLKDVYQVLKYDNGVEEMLKKYTELGVTSIKATSKGNAEETGMEVTIEALKNRKLFLAARSFSKGTVEEAASHNVNILDMSKTKLNDNLVSQPC